MQAGSGNQGLLSCLGLSFLERRNDFLPATEEKPETSRQSRERVGRSTDTGFAVADYLGVPTKFHLPQEKYSRIGTK
jgi:hypothetical protein